MADSILDSTKKILGLDSAYTAFDPDIISHINSVLFTLNQLGIGPVEGFVIIDGSATWDEFLGEGKLNQYAGVPTYVYLKVRMLFDPPQTSFAIDAMNKQILEHEWRLNVAREQTDYVDPDPPVDSVFVSPWWRE